MITAKTSGFLLDFHSPVAAEHHSETFAIPPTRHIEIEGIERVSPCVIAMIPSAVEIHSGRAFVGGVAPHFACSVFVGSREHPIWFADREPNHLLVKADRDF